MTIEEKQERTEMLINKCFNYLTDKENQNGYYSLRINKRNRLDAERTFKLYLGNLATEISLLHYDYHREQYEKIALTNKEVEEILNSLNNDNE